ncbi:hypothetical protein VFPPC_15994 [Pochonia chlamydosporia 170]|uniref:Uncharacterized protein n=1 Tax=Pochonia chlamydosporia 170 TaxID=1380566 RepID=A0A179FLX7_METCM|nr:hypothetical protein VFPPC_15994 [Pochonia chlamydosporia 170]OAQ66211.1 hypothetical protein VFPPC_15994 [Pochonia chlamydosporia 170]
MSFRLPSQDKSVHLINEYVTLMSVHFSAVFGSCRLQHGEQPRGSVKRHNDEGNCEEFTHDVE